MSLRLSLSGFFIVCHITGCPHDPPAQLFRAVGVYGAGWDLFLNCTFQYHFLDGSHYFHENQITYSNKMPNNMPIGRRMYQTTKLKIFGICSVIRYLFDSITFSSLNFFSANLFPQLWHSSSDKLSTSTTSFSAPQKLQISIVLTRLRLINRLELLLFSNFPMPQGASGGESTETAVAAG